MIQPLPHLDLLHLIHDEVPSYIQSRMLDYGCGDGVLTAAMAVRSPQAQVLGFDPFTPPRKKLTLQNLRFSQAETELHHFPFDTATSLFVLHETSPQQLAAIQAYVRKGNIIIIDYDMKNISEEEFLELFTAENELKEIQQLGFHEAYRRHTSTGLEDCLNCAQEHHLTTLHAERIRGKYYFWVGRKENVYSLRSLARYVSGMHGGTSGSLKT